MDLTNPASPHLKPCLNSFFYGNPFAHFLHNSFINNHRHDIYYIVPVIGFKAKRRKIHGAAWGNYIVPVIGFKAKPTAYRDSLLFYYIVPVIGFKAKPTLAECIAALDYIVPVIGFKAKPL